MIIEATQPSIGVGHTMTLALEMYKNVLVLYQNTPHGLLIGDPNRLLNVKRYSLKDPENLRHIIEIFMKRAQQRLLNKRFNLMLDVQQEDYLDWISKKLVVSKANYIRQLINDSIQKNKKYKKL